MRDKFFVNFRLPERIPESNDLEYLRELTKCYYGSEGQKSSLPAILKTSALTGKS